jgi:hypothetical protein
MVQDLGILGLSVPELCQLIQWCRSLQQAIVTMTEGYAERSGVVDHCFLILELRRDAKKPCCLRLDRRRGKGVSLPVLFSASCITSANDTVSNASTVPSESAHKAIVAV